MSRCLLWTWVLLAGLAAPAVAQEAPATTHWAFQPMRCPAVPVTTHTDRVLTSVDAFILARLEAEGLTLAPPADRATLLRRVTFDLTGLPPTPAEIDSPMFRRLCGFHRAGSAHN